MNKLQRAVFEAALEYHKIKSTKCAMVIDPKNCPRCVVTDKLSAACEAVEKRKKPRKK